MFSGAAIVMGVASCGKTTIGQALAKTLGARFIEGDRLHPPDNVAKMSSGTPLTDEDRWPWLDAVGAALRGEDAVIASCSALRRVYRERLAAAAGRPVRFVFLNGSKALMARRIASRKNHFMPPSLLDSQFAALEPPDGDEPARAFSVAWPVKRIVLEAQSYLLSENPHG
jgi:gluconokinase